MKWVFLLIFLAGAGESRSQQGEGEVTLIWTCPVHREVTSDAAGRCELCNRELVRATVATAWSCPVHTMVAELEEGKCPICGRDLYPITKEVVYACPMHAEVKQAEPGACPICKMDLVSSVTDRPHQDHNPKHGGIFFMAPDSWHHLEGVYPEEGVFRVYFYDNFSQPMSAAPFEARAVLEETFDARTRETREDVAAALVPVKNGEYLEARIGKDGFPREITAKVRFTKDSPFERFDFVFPGISTVKDTVSATAARSDRASPSSPEAIAAAIAERNDRVRDLVASGAFTEVYIPALEAKDLALVLEALVAPSAEREGAELAWALKELVRAAWLLDDYGDLGNREKVQFAYDRFEEAAATIASIYGAGR